LAGLSPEPSAIFLAPRAVSRTKLMTPATMTIRITRMISSAGRPVTTNPSSGSTICVSLDEPT